MEESSSKPFFSPNVAQTCGFNVAATESEGQHHHCYFYVLKDFSPPRSRLSEARHEEFYVVTPEWIAQANFYDASTIKT